MLLKIDQDIGVKRDHERSVVIARKQPWERKTTEPGTAFGRGFMEHTVRA